MIRTRTNRTTMIDQARAATIREIVPPAKNDLPERDTTRYSWGDPTEAFISRTPTQRIPVIDG